MATTVGALSVDLDLNSASFINNMKKATDSVDRSSKQMASSLGFAKNALTAFIGGAVAQKMGEWVGSSLEYASSLAEQAQQLGVTASQLQVYHYAASQVGIDNEDMDKGLQKLTLSIGQADAGAGKAIGAFDELGVHIRDTAGHTRGAGDVMADVAEALSKVQDPAKRAALEVEIFGKTGQKLDNILTGGKQGIKDWTAEAEKAGLVISDSGIAKADDAADKISKLNQQLKVNVSRIVADNASAILNLANALAQAAGAAVDFANKYPRASGAMAGAATGAMLGRVAGPYGAGAGALIGGGLGYLGGEAAADANMDINFRLSELKKAREAYRSVSHSSFGDGPIPDGTGWLDSVGVKDKLKKQTALMNQALALKRVNDAAAKAAQVRTPEDLANLLGGDGAGKGKGGKGAKAEKVTTWQDQLADLEKMLDPLKEINAQYDQSLQKLEDMAAKGQITSARFDELKTSLDAWRASQDEIGLGKLPDQIAKLPDQIDIALPKLDDLHVELLKTPTALDQAFDEARMAGMDAFINGLENIRHGFGSLKDVALSVLDAIASAILEKIIYGPLRDWASGMSGSGAGGGIFGGLFGGLFGVLGGIFGGLFGGKRALGGPVNGSKVYLVGEQGPELFAPGGSGAIIPNSVTEGNSAVQRGGAVFNISGNLLTPEFWAQIQAMDAASAQAGAELAFQRSARAQSRSLYR